MDSGPLNPRAGDDDQQDEIDCLVSTALHGIHVTY